MADIISSLNINYKSINSIIRNFIISRETDYFTSNPENDSLFYTNKQIYYTPVPFSNSIEVKNRELLKTLIDSVLNNDYKNDTILNKYKTRSYVLIVLLVLTVLSSICFVMLRNIIDEYIICFLFLGLCIILLLITNSVIIKDWERKKYGKEEKGK